MNQGNTSFSAARALLLPLLLLLGNNVAKAGDVCAAVGDYGFVCGPVSAEDLVLVPGTKWIIASGIEISADGQEFYVASSGGDQVIAYSRSNPARQLRASGLLSFIPDNLHRDNDGRLVTAGMLIDDPICGNLAGQEEFDMEKFVACPRPFIVRAIDPQTMEGTDLATSAAIAQFTNIAVGLQVGDELWTGTFAGDRIAYRSLETSD